MLYIFLSVIYYVTMLYKKRAATYVFIGGFIFLSVYHIKRMWESKRFF